MRTELKWVDEHAGGKPYGIDRVIAHLIFAHKSRLPTARRRVGWQRVISGSVGVTSSAPRICIRWCATRVF